MCWSTRVSVDIFVKWLYVQQPVNYYDNWADNDFKRDWTDDDVYGNSKRAEWYRQEALVTMRLCVLGHKLQAPVFCASAERNCVRYFLDRPLPVVDTTVYAFSSLPSDSPILQLLVDIHCDYFKEPHACETYGYENKLPREYLVRITQRRAGLKKHERVVLHECDYHGHPSIEYSNACQRERKILDLTNNEIHLRCPELVRL